MITKQPAVQVKELDRVDIDALLARHHVGRLVFAWGGRIDVRPVHYVYSDGAIYGRTSHGAKFEDLDTLPAPVAFEIDEVISLFRWRSVIAHGELRVVSPDGRNPAEWDAAIAALRTLYRNAFSEGDPVPNRSVVFRISIAELTGRAMA